MISIKWVAVIVWVCTGLVTLMKPFKVTKLEYALCWIVLLINLAARAAEV